MADIETALTGQFARDPQLSPKLNIPNTPRPDPSAVSKVLPRSRGPIPHRKPPITTCQKAVCKVHQVRAIRTPIASVEIQVVKSALSAIRMAWEQYQTTNSRDAIYLYLSAVYQTVMRWKQKNQSKRNSRLALKLHPNPIALKIEPFTVVIFCTSDLERADGKTRSKWSRVLRVVAKRKKLGQSAKDFIKDQGGINKCAAMFSELTK